MRKYWTCVGLNKRQICFLDRISKNCKFSGGGKLRRTSIVRAILNVAKKLDFDVSNVRSEKELRERFIVSFKRFS